MKLSEEALDFLKEENDIYIEIMEKIIKRDSSEESPNYKMVFFTQKRLELRKEIREFLDDLNPNKE